MGDDDGIIGFELIHELSLMTMHGGAARGDAPSAAENNDFRLRRLGTRAISFCIGGVMLS